MITVQFPEPLFRLKKRGEAAYVFDVIRKSWVRLTEEEWVRQNMIAFLTTGIKYPKESIAVEKKIMVNGLQKRFDILVYNSRQQPWMMVECKAPEVNISEDVLQQALRYTLAVPVPFIVLTNGQSTIGWKKEGEGLKMIEHLPGWE